MGQNYPECYVAIAMVSVRARDQYISCFFIPGIALATSGYVTAVCVKSLHTVYSFYIHTGTGRVTSHSTDTVVTTHRYCSYYTLVVTQ